MIGTVSELVKVLLDEYGQNKKPPTPLCSSGNYQEPMITFLIDTKVPFSFGVFLDLARSYSSYISLRVAESSFSETKGMFDEQYAVQMYSERLAEGIMGQIDPIKIFQELEPKVMEAFRGVTDYYRIFQYMTLVYEPPNCPTAYVTWNDSRRKFVMGVNRPFVVKQAIQGNFFLAPLFEKVNQSSLRPGSDAEAWEISMVLYILFTFLHEVGHVVFRHTGKDVQELQDLDHQFQNVFMDAVVNTHVMSRINCLLKSRMKRGYSLDPVNELKDVQKWAIPTHAVGGSFQPYKIAGFKKEIMYKISSQREIPGTRVSVGSLMYNLIQNKGYLEVENSPNSEFTGLMLVSPLETVKWSVPNITIMKIVAYYLSLFQRDTIDPKKKIPLPSLFDDRKQPNQPGSQPQDNNPVVKKKIAETSIQVGDFVMHKKSGNACVVTAVRDDGTFDVEDLGMTPQDLYERILKEKGEL